MSRSSIRLFLLDSAFAYFILLMYIFPCDMHMYIYGAAVSAMSILILRNLSVDQEGIFKYFVFFAHMIVFAILNLVSAATAPFLMLKKDNYGVIDSITPPKAGNDSERLMYMVKSYFYDNKLPLQYSGNRIAVFTFRDTIKFRKQDIGGEK